MHFRSQDEIKKLQKQADEVKSLIKDIPSVVSTISSKKNIIELPEYKDLYITSIKLRLNDQSKFQSFFIEPMYKIDYIPFIVTNETFHLYQKDQDNFTEVFSNNYSPLKYKDGMKFIFNSKTKILMEKDDVIIEFKDLRELEKQKLINPYTYLFQFYKKCDVLQINNHKIISKNIKSNGFLENILFKFSGNDEFDNIEIITMSIGVERKEISKHDCKKIAEENNFHQGVYLVPFELGYTGDDVRIEIKFSKNIENTVEYYLCKKNILISIDGRLLCRYIS